MGQTCHFFRRGDGYNSIAYAASNDPNHREGQGRWRRTRGGEPSNLNRTDPPHDFGDCNSSLTMPGSRAVAQPQPPGRLPSDIRYRQPPATSGTWALLLPGLRGEG